MPTWYDRLRAKMPSALQERIPERQHNLPEPRLDESRLAPAELPPKPDEWPVSPDDEPTAWGRLPNPPSTMTVPSHAENAQGELEYNVGDPVELDADPTGRTGQRRVSAVHTGGPPRYLTAEEIEAGLIPYRALEPGQVQAESGVQGTVVSVGRGTVIVRIAPHDLSILPDALKPREWKYAERTFARGGGYIFGFSKLNVIPLRLQDKRVWASRQAAQVWYHGDRAHRLTFEDQVFQSENGNAMGPGIYFTSSKQQAVGYAHPDGWVYTATVSGRLVTDDQHPTKAELRKFINALDEEGRTYLFSNWHEDSNQARRAIEQQYTTLDFVSAFADLGRQGGLDYSHSGREWCAAMTALGYVGCLHKLSSVEHLIVWDPRAITVVREEPLHATNPVTWDDVAEHPHAT